MTTEPINPTNKFLTEVSAAINEEFKVEVALPGTAENLSDIKVRVPTTSHMLNLLLGGGVPLGRVMEIYGEYSHGKSSIEEHMMIGFQRFPGVSVLLDAESGWYRERALAMGHNNDRHLHLQADTVELGFSVIESTIKRLRMPGSKIAFNMPIGIFWDTISASQTEGEKTGDQYKDGMADKARKIRAALRHLSLVLPATNCSLIFLSQTMEDLKSKFGGKTTSGGGSIKFWSSKRLSVFKTGVLDHPEKNCGIITSVRNIKDKINPPNREVLLPLVYKTGVDPLQELLIFLAENSEYVSISGGRVRIHKYPEPDREVSAYQSNIHEKLATYPDLMEYLKACANYVWRAKHGY
jgi:recombination protein RecA